jgi:hypothetical protein
LTGEYLHEFSEKFEMTLMLFSGAWEKMIHKKAGSKKSVHLKVLSSEMDPVEIRLIRQI